MSTEPPIFSGDYDANVLSNLPIDEYFKTNYPGNWHPIHYANNSDAFGYDGFEQGLNIIGKQLPSPSVYARRWLVYLSTTGGSILKEQAKGLFEIKMAAVKNQTTYSTVQAKFSTKTFAQPTSPLELFRLRTSAGQNDPIQAETLAPSRSSSQFTDDSRRSLPRRYDVLRPKWTLESGTVVEDVLNDAGKELAVSHPIHAFMIDIQDPFTKKLFNQNDWDEILKGIPKTTGYSDSASAFMGKFDEVSSLNDLKTRLDSSPAQDAECELIHSCLKNWTNIYEMNPSPFALEGKLSEKWWETHAWGVCNNLCKGIPGCFMMVGEMTGKDSTARRNFKMHAKEETPQDSRKRMGLRADFIWRSMLSPEKDWAIGEAARGRASNG
ncbi:hypothetical protein BGZ54_009769 [Gamsiella multidivaricata]|nr:hypothetical protein BGZ54_009769 [Gamsiella multidivaricata]